MEYKNEEYLKVLNKDEEVLADFKYPKLNAETTNRGDGKKVLLRDTLKLV